MNISIVISAYNEERYLGGCLESLCEEARRQSFPVEIIVVNNASTDRTAEVARRFNGVKVVDEPRKGLTRARQRGLMEASGDYIGYIDADVRLGEGWFEKLVLAYSSKSDLVSYSGPARYFDLPRYSQAFLHFLWRVSAPISYRLAGYAVLGGNFVARKDALLSVGGFDTGIDFYGEDMDIARRLSRCGKVVFDMDFFVYTSGRRFISEGVVRVCYRYAMNFIWIVVFGKPFNKTS